MNTLLFLHGALGTRQDMSQIQEQLAKRVDTAAINFYGHGGEAFDQPFTIELFAQQIIDWMVENKKEKIDIVGYSMGGYVGLYLALNFPEKVGKVATLGTKLQWNEMIAANETKRLDPVTIKEKVPLFAQRLQQLHGAGYWTRVVEKTAAMLTGMGRFNPIPFHHFNQLQSPVLLMRGDRDKQVTLVETETIYNQIANSQLAVLPNTAHSIDTVDCEGIANHISRFIGV